jgi:hypothetical protein
MTYPNTDTLKKLLLDMLLSPVIQESSGIHVPRIVILDEEDLARVLAHDLTPVIQQMVKAGAAEAEFEVISLRTRVADLERERKRSIEQHRQDLATFERETEILVAVAEAAEAYIHDLSGRNWYNLRQALFAAKKAGVHGE